MKSFLFPPFCSLFRQTITLFSCHSLCRDSGSDKKLENAQKCIEALELLKGDPHASEKERETAEALYNELCQSLVISRSLHVPVDSATAGTPVTATSSSGTEEEEEEEEEEAECLEFKSSRRRLLKYLEVDNVIDEKNLKVGDLLSDQGSFGKVYRGVYCGMPVAIKELRKDLARAESESFRIEGKTLRLLHHPFICEYVGHTENPYRIITRLYPRDVAMAVMECDVHGNPLLTLEDKFRIAYQLAAVLLYLHKNGILHRDVKLDNILLDENNNVKLADFGLSMYAPGLVYDYEAPPGSKLYMAPEMLTKFAFDSKCEVYTYGLMLYEIFTGRKVFDGVATEEELVRRQRKKDMLPLSEDDWSHRYGDGLPPRDLWTLATQCWSYYPDSRPSMEEVVNKIVTIGVHSAIPNSPKAESFWLKCSSFAYCDHLLLSEVVSFATKTDGIDLEELITDALPSSPRCLTIRDFWALCCWFPNFFASSHALMEMARIVHSPWFVSNEAEVKARLGDPTSSVFVIRPSPTEPLGAPFTLCMTKQGKQKYYHITRMLDTLSKRPLFYCNDLIYGKHFPSICALADFVVRNLELSPAITRSARSLGDVYVS